MRIAKVSSVFTSRKESSLLSNRNFWLLAIGQGVSRLGDGLFVAALAWTAWALTHSLQTVAIVTLASNLPVFVGSVIGASFADRYDRKRIMIGCDLLRALLVATLPLLYHLGWLNVTGLCVVAVLLGIAGTPFAPARNALVPEVVAASALLSANGLLQVSFRAAYFVGPLLLAPLVAFFSLPVVFLVDATTFVCSIVTLALMRIPAITSPASRPGLWADLLAGWQALRLAPEVQVVITTFVLAILVASGFLTVGVVALVGTQLHESAGQYGFLIGIAGLAEVVGALIITRLPLRNLALSAVLAWAVLGLFRLPLGFVTALPEAAALLGLTGMLSALTDIPLIALVQSQISQRHLAKVLGLWEAGIIGVMSVSPLLASFLLTHIGLQGGFVLSGTTLMVLGSASALLVVSIQAKQRKIRTTT
jgi:MFS family permease